MAPLGLIGTIFAGLGGLLLVAAALWAIRLRMKLAAWVRVQGAVVAMAGATRSRVPVVRFQGPAGPIEFRSRIGSSPPRYKAGDQVSVLYDPETPSSAIIDGWLERWFGALFLSGIGVIFAIVGGVFLASAGR